MEVHVELLQALTQLVTLLHYCPELTLDRKDITIIVPTTEGHEYCKNPYNRQNLLLQYHLSIPEHRVRSGNI